MPMCGANGMVTALLRLTAIAAIQPRGKMSSLSPSPLLLQLGRDFIVFATCEMTRLLKSQPLI
ncbi:MAG: hypothetical protein EON54_13955 [Alcaligenaceae bacterium]|nr:MAG: hypothetical protein EON54_13955 [Alcaligenaceae bacterium]